MYEAASHYVIGALRCPRCHCHRDGQNIFIYRAATADQLTVDFCVDVSVPFAPMGAVVPLETPHGVAAMTTHYGDYGRLGEANAAILAWCRANDRLRAGPSWEAIFTTLSAQARSMRRPVTRSTIARTWSFNRPMRTTAVSLLAVLGGLLGPRHLPAQVRGVYPLGMSAVNSGVTPPSGWSYINQFLYYSRSKSLGPSGEVLATGQQAVLLDMNTVAWVSRQTHALGGAYVSATATLPIAANSLTSDVLGPVSGGSGFGDSFFQPLILAWRLTRLDSRVALGFLAPTGRYTAGRNDNVGSGYWTWVASTGQTAYLTRNRATALSAFLMYEVHGTQEGTGIHPGQNLNLDYSVTQQFRLGNDLQLQVGPVGYALWQTTARTGPDLTPEQIAARYRVYGLGLACNLSLPARQVSTGIKVVDEFGGRSTYEGVALQISVAIHF